jgi:hypothetical protein
MSIGRVAYSRSFLLLDLKRSLNAKPFRVTRSSGSALRYYPFRDGHRKTRDLEELGDWGCTVRANDRNRN